MTLTCWQIERLSGNDVNLRESSVHWKTEQNSQKSLESSREFYGTCLFIWIIVRKIAISGVRSMEQFSINWGWIICILIRWSHKCALGMQPQSISKLLKLKNVHSEWKLRKCNKFFITYMKLINFSEFYNLSVCVHLASCGENWSFSTNFVHILWYEASEDESQFELK